MAKTTLQYRSLQIVVEEITKDCFQWQVKKLDGHVIAGADGDEAEESRDEAIAQAKEFINDWYEA